MSFLRLRIISTGAFTTCRLTTRTSQLRTAKTRYRLFSSLSEDESPARWYYAVDVIKTKAERFHYHATEIPEKFKPFSEVDSKALEKAFKEGIDTVQVRDDGLFQVTMSTRVVEPTYWVGPGYEVRRAIWFEEGKTPVPEELGNKLEEFHKKLNNDDLVMRTTFNFGDHKTIKFSDGGRDAVVNEQGALYVPHIQGVKYVRGTDSFIRNIFGIKESAEEPAPESDSSSAAQTLLQFSNNMKGAVEQLFGELENTWEDLSKSQMENDYSARTGDSQRREIKDLVLCIHGIGGRLSRNLETAKFVHKINEFRTLLQEIEPDNKTLVLPILWREGVTFGTTKEENKDKVSLEEVTINSIKPLRGIVADVLLDVFLYYSNPYKQQMIDSVIMELNLVYQRYVQNNPKFGSTHSVSLMAHSLGSVICFDILTKHSHKLDFNVNQFFAVGSPVGLFQTLLTKQDMAVQAKAYFNMFHPCDPVAYRVEPLFDRDAASLKPALIPWTGQAPSLMELERVSQNIQATAGGAFDSLKDTMSSVIHRKRDSSKRTAVVNVGEMELEEGSSLTKEQVNAVLAHLSAYNLRKRIDYSIQEGVFELAPIAAIASHTAYFETKDIGSFVLEALKQSRTH